MPQDEDKEAQRKLRRERAKAEEDRARDALVRHIQEQDRRLQNSRLQKEAAYQKRIAGEVARRLATPARREMYDDRALALAQQVPGPGQYTPRLQSKDNAGTTFGAAPFAKQGDPAGDGGLSGGPSSASTVYDRDAGSPDAWRVKAAAAQPGPASYSPNRPRGACGSTFGLPPELRGGKVVPPAHDLTNLVNHLRDLPAPDAYSPRNPMEKNKGFRIVPSNARSSLEQVMLEGGEVPGPGTYDLSSALSGGRSTVIKGGGQVKSELESVMERASQVPGPGRYDHRSELRARGSPRFSKGGGMSLVDAIQVEARTKPGPGTYHQTSTFEEEQATRKYMRSIIRGDEGY